MKRLAAASALIAFALFGGVTFASGSTGHVQANLPVWPKLSTKQVGRYETRLSFAVTTKPGARCGGSIAAGGQKVSLPVVIATQGLATWSWAVTAGGPSGRWSMNAQCNVSGASGKATIQPIVILPVGNRSPLIAPDSLAVAAGRSVKPLHHITTTHKTGIGAASGDPFINEKGYCTYGAWEHAQWLGSNVWGNAIDWYAEASGKLPEGTTPKAGAVFVWKIGKWGHVGLVTGPANAQGSFPTMEMNGGAMVDSVKAITTEFGKWVAHTRNVGSDMFFIYPPAPAAPVFNASAYIGHIVKQNNGNVTAWLVVNDNGPKRNWIPDQSTYECLKAKGAPGPDLLSAAQLDQMPDENGVWVHCASSPPPTTTTVSQPPPPPPTTTTAPAAPKPDTTPPSVPLGLQATSSSQTSITVAWSFDRQCRRRRVLRLPERLARLQRFSDERHLEWALVRTELHDRCRRLRRRPEPLGQATISASTAACPAPPPPAPSVTLSKGPARAGCRSRLLLHGGHPAQLPRRLPFGRLLRQRAAAGTCLHLLDDGDVVDLLLLRVRRHAGVGGGRRGQLQCRQLVIAIRYLSQPVVAFISETCREVQPCTYAL